MQEIRKFNKIIVANWKLHGSFLFINALIRNIKIGVSLQDNACIIICPPFPYINDLKSDNFFKGAQDCSVYSRGAYTGEISSKILKDLDCQFCIVGHSERRNLFNEKNEIISKKASNCLKEKIIPILCVGETLDQRNNGKTEIIIKEQLDICIDNTGIPKIIESAYSLTSHEGGRTILVGVMDKNNKLKIWTYPLHFDQEIIGSSGGQCNPNIDIPKIIKLIDNNLLDLKTLIGKTYNLDNINDAIDCLRSSTDLGRIMIKF